MDFTAKLTHVGDHGTIFGRVAGPNVRGASFQMRGSDITVIHRGEEVMRRVNSQWLPNAHDDVERGIQAAILERISYE
jgi:hypothetical protein